MFRILHRLNGRNQRGRRTQETGERVTQCKPGALMRAASGVSRAAHLCSGVSSSKNQLRRRASDLFRPSVCLFAGPARERHKSFAGQLDAPSHGLLSVSEICLRSLSLSLSGIHSRARCRHASRPERSARPPQVNYLCHLQIASGRVSSRVPRWTLGPAVGAGL